MVARREELERELERMGVERARLLADNIELDQRAGQLANETASAVAWVENLAAAETAGRASLAALDESLQGAASRRAGLPGAPLARSKWNWSASKGICAIWTRPAAGI